MGSLSFYSYYSPKFTIIMFTASELLENFNSHIAGLQFTRTPKGLYAPQNMYYLWVEKEFARC